MRDGGSKPCDMIGYLGSTNATGVGHANVSAMLSVKINTHKTQPLGPHLLEVC